MKKTETLKFLEKINGTYPNQFFITDAVKDTWVDALEPYDLEDLEDKLNQYIRGDYERPPQLPNLIKYLKTHDEKRKNIKDYIIGCDLCGKEMRMSVYDDSHRRKCLMIQAIICKGKEYGKKIGYEELDKYSYNELDRRFGNLFKGESNFSSIFKGVEQ